MFPTGDYLTKDAKFVRNPVPRSVPAPRELQKVVLPSYMIQPGDQLLVEPVNIDSQLRFPADQTVMPDGTIDLGRFGRLVVAGKTIEVIEADVAAAIRAVEPHPEPINVRLVNPQSAVYYVLGEVNSPGSYPLIGRETVLDGILAGGRFERPRLAVQYHSQPPHAAVRLPHRDSDLLPPDNPTGRHDDELPVDAGRPDHRRHAHVLRKPAAVPAFLPVLQRAAMPLPAEFGRVSRHDHL